MSAEPLLTSAELAAELRVSDRTVRRMAARGELPAVRIAESWRFRRSAVMARLAEMERAALAPLPSPIARPAQRPAAPPKPSPTPAWHPDELRAYLRESRREERRPRRAASGGANVVDLTVHQDGAASSASTLSNKEPRRS